MNKFENNKLSFYLFTICIPESISIIISGKLIILKAYHVGVSGRLGGVLFLMMTIVFFSDSIFSFTEDVNFKLTKIFFIKKMIKSRYFIIFMVMLVWRIIQNFYFFSNGFYIYFVLMILTLFSQFYFIEEILKVINRINNENK